MLNWEKEYLYNNRWLYSVNCNCIFEQINSEESMYRKMNYF